MGFVLLLAGVGAGAPLVLAGAVLLILLGAWAGAGRRVERRAPQDATASRLEATSEARGSTPDDRDGR